MSKRSNLNVEEIRLAAAKRAKALDVPLGSEGYFRILVEGTIAEMSSDKAVYEPRPLLYRSLDEVLDDSVDLVLIEAKYLDYLCHALAIEGDTRKFALIPPIADRCSFYDFRTGEDEQVVDVRGGAICSREEWKVFVDGLSSIAEALEECLNKDSGRFIGFFDSDGQLEPVCEGRTIGLVRASFSQNESTEGYLVNAIKQSDSLTEHVKSHAARYVNAIVWECIKTNDYKMDLGFYSPFTGEGHTRKIVEFPKSYGSQLFVWDSQHNGYTDLVAMTAIDEQGNETSTKVLEEEAKWRPFPSIYVESQWSVRYVALKELAKKIRRGTSLKGKDLSICGDAMDDDPWEDGLPIGYLGRGDERGFYRSYRSYYVDNASIKPEPDRRSSIVVAKRIEAIPSGQERYTLLPEDGLVLLMPRNGKSAVCYYAKGPTLVSNNLFVIWPDSEKVDPKYLTIAMNSQLVTSQFDSGKSVLGKSDLEKLLIPMADIDAMTAVVSRKQEICEEIDELRLQLDKLRREDPMAQIRRAAINLRRNDCERDDLR